MWHIIGNVYFVVSCCNVLSKTRDCLTLEDGTCMLSRNIANTNLRHAVSQRSNVHTNTMKPSIFIFTTCLTYNLKTRIWSQSLFKVNSDEWHNKFKLKEAMEVFVKYMSWSITDSPVCNCLDWNFSHPVFKLWPCLIWNLAGCKLKTFHNTKWRIQFNKLFAM
jgi:hypothetical protein